MLRSLSQKLGLSRQDSEKFDIQENAQKKAARIQSNNGGSLLFNNIALRESTESTSALGGNPGSLVATSVPEQVPADHSSMLDLAEEESNSSNVSTSNVLSGTLAELLDGENAYPLVNGVLAVKVVSAEIREGTGKDCFVFARLQVRNITKFTNNAKQWGNKLTWSEMTYFPIRIVRNPRHPFNLFQLDIFSVPDHISFRAGVRNGAHILGSVPFHVHDLVKGSPSAGSFTVLKGHRPVGKVALEIYFTYGAFGYGYSPQLNHSEAPANQVQFSMLPRSIPTAKDPWSQTLIVPAQKFNPRILDDKLHQEDFPLIHARMKRLNRLREQYESIDQRERMEKLSFLYRQINNSSTNHSMSTPPVFVEKNVSVSRHPSFFQNYMRPTLPKQ